MWRDPFTYVSLIILLAVLAPLSFAKQMRGFDPIPTAERVLDDLPEGAELVSEIANVPHNEVAQAADELAQAWNGPGLADKISDAKFDKERFDRAMITEVPRDARLELNAVRSIQTLNQAVASDGQGGFVRISTVAATVSTRLVLNDPVDGFVNARGLNEMRFQVTEPLK
ncbi:MAG: hypothetical protein ACPGGK_08170 [Pikeienuella sp.]